MGDGGSTMKLKIVVEIRGGALVGLYASDPDIEAHVVDWDEIAEYPGAIQTRTSVDAFAAMPPDTRDVLIRAARHSAAAPTG
jgi:hypothetical protein